MKSSVATRGIPPGGAEGEIVQIVGGIPAWASNEADVLNTELTGLNKAQGTVAATDTVLSAFGKVAANVENIEGKVSGLTPSLLMATDANKNLVSLSATTNPDLTEISYVKGVTSAIQTQLNGKQATVAGAATTITSSDLTASKILQSDASGKVAVVDTATYPSLAELAYVKGLNQTVATTSLPTFTRGSAITQTFNPAAIADIQSAQKRTGLTDFSAAKYATGPTGLLTGLTDMTLLSVFAIHDAVLTTTKYPLFVTDGSTLFRVISVYNGYVQASTGDQSNPSGRVEFTALNAGDKEPHACVMTLSGSTMKAYFDGVLKDSQTGLLNTGAMGANAKIQIGKDSVASNFSVFRNMVFNYVLSEDKIRRYSAGGKLDAEDIGGSTTPITSGSLVVGLRYRITVNGGSGIFTNVGAAANTVGTEFIATGTTPTAWTGSELIKLGAVAAYEGENLLPSAGIWPDSSGNNNDLTITGATVINSQDSLEIKDKLIVGGSTLLKTSSAGAQVTARIENTNTSANSNAGLELATPNGAWAVLADRTASVWAVKDTNSIYGITVYSGSGITQGRVSVPYTTPSTSSVTGALIVAGGAGIGGQLVAVSAVFGSTSGDSIALRGGNELSYRGADSDNIGMYINYTGYNDGVTRFRDLYIANGKHISIAKFVGADIGAAHVDILATTPSTSSTDGALVVSGGVGIAKELIVGGYTQLGDTTANGCPKIKMKKITGTTNAAEGGIIHIAHGVTASKIISYTVQVVYTTDSLVQQEHTRTAGYQFHTSTDGTNISVFNHATNSENILSKPFTVTIIYEE